jgi:hypothetical protein
MRNSGVDLVCLLVDGIPTFDSESFELELNGMPVLELELELELELKLDLT